MTVRFLHTADLQLGMPFGKIPGDRGARLRELRLECIDRLIETAHAGNAAFMVIAGDLFDANTVEDRVVSQACDRFGATEIPIVVIPGNHDHCAAPNCVYRRASFLRNRPRNMQVLELRQPHVMLDGAVVILPAPLMHRCEPGDTTTHITRDFGRDLAPDAVRIGLAHGGVVHFGSAADDHEDDGASNRIDPARAIAADLDYLALGDWHGLKRIDDRTWYSGAPEPTSFKQNEPGFALRVSVERHGALPVVTPVRVASTRWIEHRETLHGAADVTQLANWFEALPEKYNTVVQLELAGNLSFAENEALDDLLRAVEPKLLHLRHRANGILALASPDELGAIATDGYVKMAVEQLRAQASLEGAQGRTASLALQILHRLHRRGEPPC